jgi:hypothetical protein
MPAILAAAAPDPSDAFRRLGALISTSLFKRQHANPSNPTGCPFWCTDCMPDVDDGVLMVFHQRRVQIGDAAAFLERSYNLNGQSETTISIDRIGSNGQLSMAEARQYHAALGDLIALAESEAGR